VTRIYARGLLSFATYDDTTDAATHTRGCGSFGFGYWGNGAAPRVGEDRGRIHRITRSIYLT